jgi:hypothetical protein
VAPPPELLRVLPPPPEGAGVLLLPEEPESKERGVLVAGRLSEERDGALLLSLLRLGGV